MNQTSQSTSNSVNSQTGRDWLIASESLDAESKSEPAIVVFPDVSDAFDTTDGAFDKPIEDPMQLANALAQAKHKLPTIVPVPSQTDPTNSISISLDTIRDNISADLAEPATDWTDSTSPKESSRQETTKKPNSPKPRPTNSSDAENYLQKVEAGDTETSQAISKLVDSIVERYPIGDPTVLTFIGSEANLHIDETCARVASELSNRKIGRILLLDADPVARSLSEASGIHGQPGMTDVINKSVAWKSAVYGRSSTGLDFIGVGTEDFKHVDSQSRLRNVIAEMKLDYQFICIAAGDAHSKSSRLFNDLCDGSYLLVSVKNTNEQVAKSAVAEMRSSGARLLGCIVTDVD